MRKAKKHLAELDQATESFEKVRIERYPLPDGVIVLPSNHTPVHLAARHAFRLACARGANLYWRGGAGVVQVNASALKRVDAVVLQSLLPAIAPTMAWAVPTGGRAPVLTGKKPNKEEMESILAAVADAFSTDNAAATYLPRVTLLSSAPVLRRVDAGGRRGKLVLLEAPGLHPGGVYITGKPLKLPTLNVKQAVAEVLALIRDYTFHTRADKARAVAALVSPALRRAKLITGVAPIDITEADQPQAGKTALQHSNAIIYTGAPARLVTRKEDRAVDSPDEQLSAAIAAGALHALLDNWRGHFGSAMLEAVVTSPGDVSLRLAFAPRTQADASDMVIGISSNGLSITPDLAARSNVIVMRKRVGAKFKTDSIVEIARKRRVRLLAAAYAIAREWHRRGCPRTDVQMDVFTEWAQSLDWIVQKMFRLPGLRTGMADIKRRLASPGLAFVRELGLAVLSGKRRGTWLSPGELADIARERALSFAEGSAGDADVARAIGRTLGQAFAQCGEDAGKFERIAVEDIVVLRYTWEEKREGHRDMRPVHRYRFVPKDEKRLPTPPLEAGGAKTVPHVPHVPHGV